MLTGDHFGGGHAFVFGLVGQHGAFDHIADGVDTRHRGAPLGVYSDLAALCHLDAKRFVPKAVVERLAACGDQDDVGVQHMFAVVLAQLVVDFGLGLGGFGLLHGSAHDEVQALLFQRALEGLLHLWVHAGGDDIKKFHHGHFGAEAGVDAAQLQPDDACADDHHFLGDLAQLQRAGGGDDDFLVHFDARQGRRLGPGGDDDVFGLMDLIADLHFAGLRDGAPAFDPVDLVLFEQELDAAGVAVDGFALVGQHLLPIHGRRFALETHLSKVVLGLMQHVAGVQERFGGDAAHV